MEQSVCAVASVHVRIFATPGTVAHQAALSMGFSRQQYWSGLPCPLPGDLSDPRMEPESLTSLALAGGFFTWEAPFLHEVILNIMNLWGPLHLNADDSSTHTPPHFFSES